MSNRLVWVVQGIEQLMSLIILLEEKGFEIVPVTNVDDAVTMIRDRAFDLVFLDEQMPGMDGLATLEKIKAEQSGLPVVMITKSEEESIMDDAIGGQISDYLIKPVNPNQILLSVKKLLDRRRLQNENISLTYLTQYNKLYARFGSSVNWQDWVEIYRQLTRVEGRES